MTKKKVTRRCCVVLQRSFQNDKKSSLLVFSNFKVALEWLNKKRPKKDQLNYSSAYRDIATFGLITNLYKSDITHIIRAEINSVSAVQEQIRMSL
jgi:hypothetical protein